MAKNIASRRRTRLALTTIPLIVGVALIGCTAEGADEATGNSEPARDAFEHIHGLGADTLTGNTYAATHQGIWLLPTRALPAAYLDGAPRNGVTEPFQIAGRGQDAMGFTVAAPGLLLASGHPDPSDENDLELPNVGLESSIDGAETWTSVSLRGQTDFHDLDAVPLSPDHLRVYGYDAGSGRVSISDDTGETWTSGATVALRDLAADPTKPSQLFATTAAGLAVSNDAGKTFDLIPDAPGLLLVDTVTSSNGTSLIGVDPAGVIWRQDAATKSWNQTGTTNGAPEAFSVIDGTLPWILVADDSGISASHDVGRTWTVLVARTR